MNWSQNEIKANENGTQRFRKYDKKLVFFRVRGGRALLPQEIDGDRQGFGNFYRSHREDDAAESVKQTLRAIR